MLALVADSVFTMLLDDCAPASTAYSLFLSEHGHQQVTAIRHGPATWSVADLQLPPFDDTINSIILAQLCLHDCDADELSLAQGCSNDTLCGNVMQECTHHVDVLFVSSILTRLLCRRLLTHQPRLLPHKPGVFSNQPCLLTDQPGIFPNQPCLLANQPGLFTN